jgi:hypothetical protein
MAWNERERGPEFRVRRRAAGSKVVKITDTKPSGQTFIPI